jgi:peptidoglycan/LPS O-acetylase OafA/YrhL
MQINISDPIFQTYIFVIGLAFFTLVTLRKDKDRHEMLISHTNELKGLAILLVLFSHVGYFLSSDTRFLYPLSAGGGVGVNIFLFLSGFGVTASMLKKQLKPWEFYKRRLPTIYIPMWVVLTLVLILDFLLLQRIYPSTTLVKNYLGFFPRADIFLDLNSPLWYFSFILFYYLVFPWVFVKKYTSVSALIIFLISLLILDTRLPVVFDVHKLYVLHTLAFPLGMIFATFLNLKPLTEIKEQFFQLRESHRKIAHLFRVLFLWILAILVYYTLIESGVGKGLKTEQVVSIFITLAFVLFVLLKRYKSNFLVLLGIYSYEIYLIQWPLMYRYDFIYKYVPAGLGTLLYIFVLLALGWGLNRFTNLFLKHKKHHIPTS